MACVLGAQHRQNEAKSRRATNVISGMRRVAHRWREERGSASFRERSPTANERAHRGRSRLGFRSLALHRRRNPRDWLEV